MRPCEMPVVESCVTDNSLVSPPPESQFEQVELEGSDPDCVVLEEVTFPNLEETEGVDVEMPRPSEEASVDPVPVGVEQQASASGQPSECVVTPNVDRPVSRRPVPTPRKTHRPNAGVHSNPFNEPRSVCNSTSLSPEVFSQVLTSLGTVFFREAVKEVKNMYRVIEDNDSQQGRVWPVVKI